MRASGQACLRRWRGSRSRRDKANHSPC
jgi:hypothetical protein